VTLGFYRFWGKTRLRRYMWSHLRLLGDRLEYTGTGKELFFGFLIVLAILIPIFVVYGFLDIWSATQGILQNGVLTLLAYMFFAFLGGVALFRARRYRMTRTAWRGISFGLTGSGARYGVQFLCYSFLTILTLGLARPLGEVRLQSYLMNNSWFGSGEFRFDGRAGELFRRWALCWLLIPVTLGLSLMWYAAARTRYFAERTRFQTLHFAMPVTFGDLARILLPYFLVLALLFGLLALYATFSGLAATMRSGIGVDPGTVGGALPAILAFFLFFLLLPALQVVMVTHRFMRLMADRLAVEGEADIDAILQNAQTAPRTGEGLADALDVGGGLGVGF